MRSGASKVPEERRWTRNSKNNGKPRLPRRELLSCGASPLRPRPQSTSVMPMPLQVYLMYFCEMDGLVSNSKHFHHFLSTPVAGRISVVSPAGSTRKTPPRSTICGDYHLISITTVLYLLNQAQYLTISMRAVSLEGVSKRKRSVTSFSQPCPPKLRRSRRGRHDNGPSACETPNAVSETGFQGNKTRASIKDSAARPAGCRAPQVDTTSPRPLTPTALLTSMERRSIGISGLLRASFSGNAAEFEAEAHRLCALIPAKLLSSFTSLSSAAAFSSEWTRADARGRSILHGAASSGHPTILQHVLDAKVFDIDQPAEGGLTALCYALDRRDFVGATTLLAAGANADKVESLYGFWDAAWATERMGMFGTPRADALDILRTALSQALVQNDDRCRPWLDLTTQHGLFEEWKASLKVGSRVDARDCDYRWYEAEVVGTFERGVRVSYLSWGRRFDEDLSLDSLRVLPAYSVVPAWRETLSVGSHVEILATAAGPMAAGSTSAAATLPSPEDPQERKWWDATAVDIQRSRRRILLSVDGRPSVTRWVDMDGREIADIGTHVKPAPPPLLPPQTLAGSLLEVQDDATGDVGASSAASISHSRGGKEPVAASPRQEEASKAANDGDLARLLALINVQDPVALRFIYFRRKLQLGMISRLNPPALGPGSLLHNGRRRRGKLGLIFHQQVEKHHDKRPKKRHVETASLEFPSCKKRRTSKLLYAELRKNVLRYVVTDLKEDLFKEFLQEYL